MSKVRNYNIVAILFFFAIAFAGCGGSSSPGTGGNATHFVTLTAFSVTPTTLSDGQSLTVNATTAFDAPSQIYTFEFHLTTDTSMLSNTTKIFGLNCGGALQVCIESIEVFCDRNDATIGFPKFTCSLGGSIIDTETISTTGDLFAVGESCIFDANQTRVCDRKTISVTILQ